jgi:pilus assembly protein CpaB
MKWPIVGLIVAGFAAAVCAAVLVAAMKADDRGAGMTTKEGSVVVAKRDLPAMAILTGDDVEQHTLPPSQVPKGSLGDPAQVVGRALAAPLLKGQPFMPNSFASKGTGFQLASVLPDGMRAVNLSLTSHGGMRGLLYPGSLVDVIATFKSAGEGSDGGKYVSMTLLEAVQVLAVEDRTVGSEDTDAPEGDSSSSIGRLKRQTVTLMVTPEQAEAIQLAEDRGTISLAMRNPMDGGSSKGAPMAFSELTDKWIARAPVRTIKPAENPFVAASNTDRTPAPAQWETTVIRGTKTERCVLPLPQ